MRERNAKLKIREVDQVAIMKHRSTRSHSAGFNCNRMNAQSRYEHNPVKATDIANSLSIVTPKQDILPNC